MIEQALHTAPFAVVAHRGGGLEAPENTIKAIRHAVRIKADIVEVDVRSTKDGELILLHDSDFGRVAGVDRKALDLDLATIKERITIGGEPVATLQEALEAAKGKIAMFLEIKEPATVARVVELVQKLDMQRDVCIISFYEEALREAKRLDSSIATGLVYSYPPGKIKEAKELGCALVLPHYRLASAKANRFAHALGLQVGVWTVNETDMAIAVYEKGADLIASDYPKMVLKLREKLREGGIVEQHRCHCIIEEIDERLVRKIVYDDEHYLIEQEAKDTNYKRLKESFNYQFFLFDEYRAGELSDEVVFMGRIKRSKLEEFLKKLG